MKDLENWYTFVFNNSGGDFTPPLLTKNRKILRKLCEQKGVEIIEAQACPDHIHMLVSIPPSISVS